MRFFISNRTLCLFCSQIFNISIIFVIPSCTDILDSWQYRNKVTNVCVGNADGPPTIAFLSGFSLQVLYNVVDHHLLWSIIVFKKFLNHRSFYINCSIGILMFFKKEMNNWHPLCNDRSTSEITVPGSIPCQWFLSII